MTFVRRTRYVELTELDFNAKLLDNVEKEKIDFRNDLGELDQYEGDEHGLNRFLKPLNDKVDLIMAGWNLAKKTPELSKALTDFSNSIKEFSKISPQIKVLSEKISKAVSFWNNSKVKPLINPNDIEKTLMDIESSALNKGDQLKALFQTYLYAVDQQRVYKVQLREVNGDLGNLFEGRSSTKWTTALSEFHYSGDKNSESLKSLLQEHFSEKEKLEKRKLDLEEKLKLNHPKNMTFKVTQVAQRLGIAVLFDRMKQGIELQKSKILMTFSHGSFASALVFSDRTW